MSNPMSLVSTRIGAMRGLLDATAGKDGASVSETQTKSLLILLKTVGAVSSPLVKRNSAAWVQAILDMAPLLRQEDCDAIIPAVVEVPKKPHTGWSMQNYVAICSYYSGAEWSPWMHPDATMSFLHQFTFARARRLRCEHPSEPTTKM